MTSFLQLLELLLVIALLRQFLAETVRQGEQLGYVVHLVFVLQSVDEVDAFVEAVQLLGVDFHLALFAGDFVGDVREFHGGLMEAVPDLFKIGTQVAQGFTFGLYGLELLQHVALLLLGELLCGGVEV